MSTTKKAPRRTKLGDILRYLLRYGSITDPVARTKYHTNRLSDVIFRLRKKGYDIETIMCNGRDEFGTYTFAKYVIVK